MNQYFVLRRLASLLQAGIPIAKAVASLDPLNKNQEVDYYLALAKISGSGVAKELEATAKSLLSRQKVASKIRIAQVSPKATARLLLVLPLLTLGLSQLSGVNVLGALSARPALALSLALGLGLLGLAKWISGILIAKASATESFEGSLLLGLGLLVSCGMNYKKAVDVATDVYIKIFGETPSSREVREIAQVGEYLGHSGSRITKLLRSKADEIQMEKLQKSQIAAEKLGIRLLLPLGLAVIPAFLLIAVLPLTVSMVS